MSRPRYDWWSYVKGMIRRFPALREEYKELHVQSMSFDLSGMPKGGNAGRSTEELALRDLPHTKQRELEAVARAVEATRRMPSGQDRLRIIDLVYWKKSHTLDGAAYQVGYSYRTARRFHTDFIMLVAANYGLLD